MCGVVIFREGEAYAYTIPCQLIQTVLEFVQGLLKFFGG